MITLLSTLFILANGIHPFYTTPTLTSYAQTRVEQICQTVEFSHRLWKPISLYTYSGENLALGFNNNPKGVMNAWLNSPTHKANLITPKFQYIGIAVKECYGYFVYAEEFGGY